MSTEEVSGSANRLLHADDIRDADDISDADDTESTDRLLEGHEHGSLGEEESVDKILLSIVNMQEKLDTEKTKSREPRSDRPGAIEMMTLNLGDSDLDLPQNVQKMINRVHKCAPEASNTEAKQTKPQSPAALERQRRMRELLKKQDSRVGKIACGVYCIIFILGIGAGLIFAAFALGVPDLYIVGGVFTAGGITFMVGFLLVWCCFKYDDVDYSSLYVDKV